MQVDWGAWQPTVRATLLFIAVDGKVLLIRKKRGFGQGKINGPGGKLDPGESESACAIRETEEELRVHAHRVQKRGELWFQFVDGLAMHVAVFCSHEYEGTATETEEAAPLWFPVDEIPFDEMWADDRHWLHRMLVTGENFLGRFTFDGDVMLWHEVTWSDESPWTPPRAEAGGMECGFAC